MRGFLSFVIASVFLLAIVAAGAVVSNSKPSLSYEQYRAMLAKEVAIKQAYYASCKQAASAALAASLAAAASGEEVDPREWVKKAAYLRSIEAELQLKELGADIVFWCGLVDSASRKAATEEMDSSRRAVIPAGAKPIYECYDAYDFDIVSLKLYFRDAGFSFYDGAIGRGAVAVLPNSFAVSIGEEE